VKDRHVRETTRPIQSRAVHSRTGTAAGPQRNTVSVRILAAPLQAWVESIHRLVPEPLDSVLHQIGPNHAFHQPRLPCLVDHVSAIRWLEVRSQFFQQRRKFHQLLGAAALGVAHAQARRRGHGVNQFHAPNTDPALPPVLLEHPWALAESFWQFLLKLLEAFDSTHVAAEWEIARVEQDVLGSQLQDTQSGADPPRRFDRLLIRRTEICFRPRAAFG